MLTSKHSKETEEGKLVLWLITWGLEKYTEPFLQNRFTLANLHSVPQSKFKALGVESKDLRIIEEAIRQGKTELSPRTLRTPPSRKTTRLSPFSLRKKIGKASLKVLLIDVEVSKEYEFKILVLGPYSSGKTSLISRYVNDKFDRNLKATIGVDYYQSEIAYDDRTTCIININDCSGQDRFQSLVSSYYRGASAALVVFDSTEMKSLNKALEWKRHLDEKEISNGNPMPVVLVANKIDLEHEIPVALEKVARENNFSSVVQTSALTSQGVEQAFKTAVQDLMRGDPQHLAKFLKGKSSKAHDTINLVKPLKKENKCCN